MTRAVTNWRVAGIALLAALVSGLIAVTAVTADASRTTRTTIPAAGKQAGFRFGQPYEATMLACRRSARTDARSATVAAAMRPIPGATRLSLRVDLYQRDLTAHSRWTARIDVPGLGVWTQPADPSIGTRPNDVFKYRQTVGRLVVPYAYRFRASFRWYDTAGQLVREASATTAPCREPDLRPDLTIVRIDVEPHPNPLLARYVALVRNVGRSTATQVTVGPLVEGSGATAVQRVIPRLRPQEMSEVTLLASRCEPGAEPAFAVDPNRTVDESDESNNALRATCPATLDGP